MSAHDQNYAPNTPYREEPYYPTYYFSSINGGGHLLRDVFQKPKRNTSFHVPFYKSIPRRKRR